MDLKIWWPVVTKAVMAGNALAIQIILSCSSCHVELTFKTGGHLMGVDEKSREQLIEWKLNELIKLKGCPSCGAVSTLPKRDRICLSEGMRNLITISWLSRHSQERNPQDQNPEPLEIPRDVCFPVYTDR